MRVEMPKGRRPLLWVYLCTSMSNGHRGQPVPQGEMASGGAVASRTGPAWLVLLPVCTPNKVVQQSKAGSSPQG